MTRHLRRGARALLFALALLGSARVVSATDPESSARERAAALALSERARALVLEGNAAKACPLLEESQRLDATLSTQLELGACQEATGKLATAYAWFLKVAGAAYEVGEFDLGERAMSSARQLEPRLSKLRIVLSDGQLGAVEVERDGVVLDEKQLGVEVPVDAGSHYIRAFGDGLAAWSVHIDLNEQVGVHTVQVPRLAAKLLVPHLQLGDDSSDAAHEPRGRSFLGPTHRKVAVIAGGVGVLGIGIGGVFGFRAIAKSDASDRAGCFGNVCPTLAGVELRREAQVAGNVATASMIGGLAGLATAAAVFLLVDGTSSRAASSVAPRASASSGEIIWQGQF